MHGAYTCMRKHIYAKSRIFPPIFASFDGVGCLFLRYSVVIIYKTYWCSGQWPATPRPNWQVGVVASISLVV